MKNKVKFRQLGSVTLFVLPAFIPLIVFWIYPILRSVYISFTDWDYMTPDYNFVFFDNFISLFQDARFYDALWNTVVFTLGTLIPTIVLGLMLALLMQKAFKGSGIIKFYFVFAMDHADCCSVDRMDLDLRSEYGNCKYGNEISASPRITVD